MTELSLEYGLTFLLGFASGWLALMLTRTVVRFIKRIAERLPREKLAKQDLEHLEHI